jgi:aminoglycoside phosphotransferase (APT) family kinase protein
MSTLRAGSVAAAAAVAVARPEWRPVDERDVAAWWRRAPGTRGRLERVTIAVVRDAPGKRLTARCRLESVARDGRRERVTVYAKQYRRRDLAERLARQLGTLRFAPGDAPVRVPRLLGLDARRGVVYLEALAGSRFESTLATPGSALEPAGALLAAFHRATAEVEKQVTRASELARTRECAQEVALALPGSAPALDRILTVLSATRWPRAGGHALLHGSFRPNHLLRQRGALAVLDLESLRIGPAGYDIANWIAALHYAEVEGRLDAAARRRATRALLRGYAASGGAESGARVLWLTAALLVQKQLLKLATRPGPGSAAGVRTLLARAGRCADRAAAMRARDGLDALAGELA